MSADPTIDVQLGVEGMDKAESEEEANGRWRDPLHYKRRAILPSLRRTMAPAAEANAADDQFLAADLDTMETMEAAAAARGRRPLTLVTKNIVMMAVLHAAGLYGGYLMFTAVVSWKTYVWTAFVYMLGALGITAGAHRLWAHRSYKAHLPLRIFLMLCNNVAWQNDIIEWARDHRCHHKWTDTEADPHNSRRGFFYSHVGWLMARKTEELKRMGEKIDLSDLQNDPVLDFQRKHYCSLAVLFCWLLPAAVPVYFWGESGFVSFYAVSLFRQILVLNVTWLINSAAHAWGYKPYDASITAVQSMLTNIPAMGEDMHNFHHSFPQDYRATEFSWLTNWTWFFIDSMCYLGLAYDRKITSKESINRQCASKGDRTYQYAHVH